MPSISRIILIESVKNSKTRNTIYHSRSSNKLPIIFAVITYFWSAEAGGGFKSRKRVARSRCGKERRSARARRIHVRVGIRISCKIPTLRETTEHLDDDAVGRNCRRAGCVQRVALIDGRFAHEPLDANGGGEMGEWRKRVEPTGYTRALNERDARLAHAFLVRRRIMTRTILNTAGGQTKTMHRRNRANQNVLARRDVKTLMKRPFMRARLMNGCGVRLILKAARRYKNESAFA